MATLALDIGGANIKSAHSGGAAGSVAFALWREPATLADQLRQIIASAEPFDRVLVTMTGELCDCFETKRQGVSHILSAVEAAAENRTVLVWVTDGMFVPPSEARLHPLRAAAANWHALATFTARLWPDKLSLLIDTGSTTTDIIRLRDGRPDATGLTDTDRLATGELVYLGAQRTLLAALGPKVPWRGKPYNVMAEFFATLADVHVLTGDVAEDATRTDTGDNRPLTRALSAARVLRMVGADTESSTHAEAEALARAFAEVARQRVADAVKQVVGSDQPKRIVISGSGGFIARDAARLALPNVPVEHLADRIGPEASSAACAYALLRLMESA